MNEKQTSKQTNKSCLTIRCLLACWYLQLHEQEEEPLSTKRNYEELLAESLPIE